MSRRKSDDTSGQLAVKRTRTSAPVFRVARMPAATNRASRVTVIRKGVRGRRGHVTEGIVHSPDGIPDPSIDQQPETDAIAPEPLSPDFLQLEDSTTSIPPLPPKPKRARKNTTSVRSLLVSSRACS
jgi:hypothetical protein